MIHHSFLRHQRFAFVESLLNDQFTTEKPAEITEIAYDEKTKFECNNFVYKIALPSPWNFNPESKQHGCVTIPEWTPTIILRLSNPNAKSMNRRNRIENEVACIKIASEALENIKPNIIPRVYAWGSAAEGTQGWIMQEYMPGKKIEPKEFGTVEWKSLFEQMAEILKALQAYRLPPGVTGHGGLTFNSLSGEIVSSFEPSFDEGPWCTYKEAVKERLKVTLNRVEQNGWVRGWQRKGIREGLDSFIEDGIAQMLASLDDQKSKCLVHADFNYQNMLYEEGKITALLDFDFAHVAHPLEEFLRSFRGTGGVLQGWSGEREDPETQVRDAKISGGFPRGSRDFEKLRDDMKKADEHITELEVQLDKAVQQKDTLIELRDMAVASMWEQALEMQEGIKRPVNIAGMREVVFVDSFLEKVEPHRLTNPVPLHDDNQPREAKEAFLEKSEKDLLMMLKYARDKGAKSLPTDVSQTV